MKRVVFDTNALLLPVLDGTDLRAELERLVGATEWLVPQSVHAELERLATGRDATARAARTALALIRQVRIEATELPGDDGVLDVARRAHALVVSNDRRLVAECAKSGLQVASSRGKGKLHLAKP
jgi:uncharacterized protein